MIEPEDLSDLVHRDVGSGQRLLLEQNVRAVSPCQPLRQRFTPYLGVVENSETGGRNGPKSVVGFVRNGWSDCSETRRHAFGIAGSLAGGVRANFGTMTKPLHAGECGRAAIEAGMLAKAGFTAAQDIIECGLGYGDTLLGHSEYDPDRIVTDLGSPYIAERGITIKKYACCYCNHATLDGIFAMLDEHVLETADVASVHVTGSPLLRDPLIYTHPKSGLESKFSLHYSIALALVDRMISSSSYSDRRVSDPRLAEIIDKVSVQTIDDWASVSSVRIEIQTARGEKLEHLQEFVNGDETHPLGYGEVVEKFRDNAALALDGEAIEQTVEAIEGLDSHSSVDDLIAALTPQVATR
jgi:2-methylcitrate dehydratase PrpD